MVKLVFLSGSSQKKSVNSRLVRAAAEVFEKTYGDGVEVTLIDLADYDTPVFDGAVADPENLPENARKLRDILTESGGIFMGSDEYTGSYSTLLRNTLGWLTLTPKGRKPVFDNLPIALCGASPQGVGGLRGHPALTQLLRSIGATVIAQHLSLGTYATAFDDQGLLLPGVEKQLALDAVPKLFDAAQKRGAAVPA